MNLWYLYTVFANRRMGSFYLHTLFAGSPALRYLKEDHEVIPILRSLLTDNPPSPGKVSHTAGVYVLYSFRTVRCGFFYIPQESVEGKCCETGPTVFSPLTEMTRKSNHLQMSLQRQHVLFSYLKTLSVGPAGVWTRDLPLSKPALSQLS